MRRKKTAAETSAAEKALIRELTAVGITRIEVPSASVDHLQQSMPQVTREKEQ